METNAKNVNKFNVPTFWRSGPKLLHINSDRYYKSVHTCPRSSVSQSEDLYTASKGSQRKQTHIVSSSIAVTRTFPHLLKVAASEHINPKDSRKKMDTCVPSPNVINAPFLPSPHSYSIYEQDRPNMYYGSSKVDYNLDVCGAVLEDSSLLDDNYEDATLGNILTPEILNSMASSSSASGFPPTNLWNSKMTMNESSSLDQGAEPPFIQLGMDSEIFIPELLNLDSNDSKFSFPDFDCMTSNPPSSCQTPTPSEPKSEFVDHLSADRVNFVSRNKENMSSSATNLDIMGQDFVQKKFPTMKSNFPPRKSEPPVGIVAPVKIPEVSKTFMDHHPVKMEEEELKSSFNTSCAADFAEASPQTVPSFNVSNVETGYNNPIKSEPISPENTSRRGCLKRSSTDDKWEVVKQYMLPEEPVPAVKSKRRRCDSGSSGITSEDGDEDDNDYAFHNDYESDDDNSDLDADLAHMKPGSCESLIGAGKKQKQYFWQYNVQAKGPKGTRLKLAVETPADPHVLNGFEDPVFDEGNTTVAGIRHGGKARKGDGNEVTPNPHKLFKIGHQLLRLNKKINACQLGSDVPLAQRNESRKEKNKLASRACRLKKKAQHEANKIKLHGLEMEHGQINNVLRLLWPELRERAKRIQNEHQIDEKPDPENNLFNKLTGYISSNLKTMVAGNTTDYVNNVIMTVEKGDLSGGLKVRRKT